MGCSLCKPRASSSPVSAPSSSTLLNVVRLIHLNGYIEDYDYPIRVNQVMGIGHITDKSPPTHFIISPSQLLSPNSFSARPLKPDTILQLGQVYLFLPYSSLRADVSPLDLASVAHKLLALAKSNNKGSRDPVVSSPLQVGPSQVVVNGSSPTWNAGSSPLHGGSMSPVWSSPGRTSSNRSTEVDPVYGAQRLSVAGSKSNWKPLLDTIKEKPLHKRSDSDLQEHSFRQASK